MQNFLLNLRDPLGYHEVILDRFLSFLRVKISINYVKSEFAIGLTHKNNKNFKNALSCFEKSLSAFNYLRNSLSSKDDTNENRRKITSEFYILYQKIIETCLDLNDISQALIYVERAKARTLSESVIYDHLMIGGISGNLDRALQGLSNLGKSPVKKKNKFNVKFRSFNEANTKYSYLAFFLRHFWYLFFKAISKLDPENWELKNSDIITYDEIQKSIDNKTALIQYYICSNYICTLVVTRNSSSPKLYKSKYEDLLDLKHWIENYKDYLSRTSSIRKKDGKLEFENLLKELSLILKINDWVTDIPSFCNKLVLVPHLYLYLCPFASLPINRFSKDYLLMDLFERGVSYIPSCTYLLNTIDRLQISDPEHIGQDESSTPNIIGFVDKSLDFSDVEVGAISKHFSNSIFVEDFLQGVYLLSVSAGYYRTGMDYIHFACHGYFNPEDPSLSALLSQKSGLRLKDLAHDYQNYRLATLSACETGITDLEDLSSDYVSLASAFLHKSCSNVVCSLWRVDNLSTALMMIKFYDNIFMNSKTTIPVALKNAQYWLKDLTKIELENWISKKEWNVIQLKKLKHYMPATNVGDYDKPFASPFFWSGFYAIGME